MSSFAVSTIPAAKDYLFTLLKTACTQDPLNDMDLLVRFGEPGPFDPQDVVSVGAATRDVEPFGMRTDLQTGSLRENYTLAIDIDVMRGGTDPGQTATDRLWVLIGQVETAVRADPTLGGNVIYAYPIRSTETTGWDEKHAYYLAGCVVEITISAVI